MPKKKAKKIPRSAVRPGGSWATTPLAELLDSLVCECRGPTVLAINEAGRALLGYGGKKTPVGKPFAHHVEAQLAGRLKRSVLLLAKGKQPKRIQLTRCDGATVPVELRAKITGGTGARACVLITARAATPRAVEPAPRPVSSIQAPELSRQTTQILGAASDGIVAVNHDGIILLANLAAGDLLNRDAGAMTGLNIERAFVYGSGHPNAGQPVPLRARLETGPYYIEHDIHLGRTDGESFEAVYVVAPFTENRTIAGYVITFRDVTQRRRADAELRLAAAVFDHSPEGLIIADAKGHVTKVNPAYRRITGIDHGDIVGKSLSDVLFTGATVSPSILETLKEGTEALWEHWAKNKAGKRYAARISVSVVRDNHGSTQQYVGMISDITQRKLDEEKITYQANYDQLTNLPNRTLFMDRLTRLVLESRRAKNSVGLMFIDLDGFKAINDNLGHDAGDLLLDGTARRLEKCIREADTVARLGGDEFTVIMPLIDNFEAAAIVAGRIIKSLTEPFDLAGREGRVSASIGISLLPAQAASADELLHNADVAMYHAKRQGKANYQFYRPELEKTVELKPRAL